MSVLSDRSNSSSSGPSGNGVGLSNPQLAQGRRSMLDLVNRLHSTGSVCLSFLLTRLIFLARSMQCASRYWPSPNCCHWFTECWKVFAHWIHIWNYSTSCSWDLYTVCIPSFFCIDLLTHTSQLLVVLQSADSHDPTPLGNVLFPSGSSPTHRGNY